MIPKDQLQHMHWYIGEHRCTKAAKWDKDAQEFLYIKHEFQYNLTDTAKHPEDDDGFALFKPLKHIEIQ